MRRMECIGHLGDDAELKVTQGGETVVNFRIGTNGRKKDDETLWVRCAVFGARADKLRQYLTKGKQVFVRGPVNVSQWAKEDRSGVSVDLVVDEIELLGGGEKSEKPDPFARRG